MHYKKLDIPDVVLITPEVYTDNRGFFMETFKQNEFERECGPYTFVQDNHSLSHKGILRGMHYQYEKPQGKLVRVIKGEVYDVAVDLRQNSTTFGKWVGEFLSENNKKMLWIPPGFAHGFLVISEQAEFIYKCTDFYNPGDEYSLLWNDNDIDIKWPNIDIEIMLSDKDKSGSSLQDAIKF